MAVVERFEQESLQKITVVKRWPLEVRLLSCSFFNREEPPSGSVNKSSLLLLLFPPLYGLFVTVKTVF